MNRFLFRSGKLGYRVFTVFTIKEPKIMQRSIA